jgi:DNA polymerase-1
VSTTEQLRLVILDGHGIIHRAYWGNRDHPLSVRRTGETVTAVFGFANTLLSVLKSLQPTHIAVAMDAPGPTFRHEKAETYKAHRPPMPDDLSNQFSRVREVIQAFNIPIYELTGYEADDVLGSLARQAKALGVETYLVTLDSDIVQLVEPGVFCYMYRLFQRDTVIYDTAGVIERYGVRPEQIPDLKGLKGDTSDNIPGVPGIGEKTALKLVQEFGGVPQVLEHIDEVKPAKVQESLRQHGEQALFSREMATIDRNAPVELELERCELQDFEREQVDDLFFELEFRSLMPRVAELAGAQAQRPPARPSDEPEPEYETVTSLEQLERVVAEIRAAKRFAFDTETTSTNPMTAQLVGISLSPEPYRGYYIPVGHIPSLEGPDQLDVEVVLDRLRPLFDDPEIDRTAHNAKYDMVVLWNAGLHVDHVDADTMIAAFLMGDRDIGLKSLARAFLGVTMTPISSLIGTGSKQITMAQVPVESAAKYAAADADMTLRLRPLLEQEVRERGLFDLYKTIEMPLIGVLMHMELTGVAVEVEVLREMARTLTDDLQRLEREICDCVGHQFNMSSPRQLSQVLFEELNLPKTRKTTQGYTTDAQALEGLRGQHPIVDLILEYRQVAKLKSTYIDALPGMINPHTGRIHTTYGQTGAATGRISSSDPNLQNIPVRTELGRQVRKAFVARDPQGKRPPNQMSLLAADYSQIELRILAHISQEPRLIEAFQADEDIHKATAADLFGVPIDQVNADQRRLAKTVNFAVIYGLSAMGLSQRTELSRSESAEFIDAYFARYPGIRRYLDDTVASTRKRGYAETLLGRRRYLPEINAGNINLRQQAERMATNHPIQGTNADIIKIAMDQIAEALPANELGSKMILQVHDELIFECPDVELDDMRRLVPELMCSAMTLSVPLKVETKTGKNWGEME